MSEFIEDFDMMMDSIRKSGDIPGMMDIMKKKKKKPQKEYGVDPATGKPRSPEDQAAHQAQVKQDTKENRPHRKINNPYTHQFQQEGDRYSRSGYGDVFPKTTLIEEVPSMGRRQLNADSQARLDTGIGRGGTQNVSMLPSSNGSSYTPTPRVTYQQGKMKGRNATNDLLDPEPRHLSEEEQAEMDAKRKAAEAGGFTGEGVTEKQPYAGMYGGAGRSTLNPDPTPKKQIGLQSTPAPASAVGTDEQRAAAQTKVNEFAARAKELFPDPEIDSETGVVVNGSWEDTYARRNKWINDKMHEVMIDGYFVADLMRNVSNYNVSREELENIAAEQRKINDAREEAFNEEQKRQIAEHGAIQVPVYDDFQYEPPKNALQQAIEYARLPSTSGPKGYVERPNIIYRPDPDGETEKKPSTPTETSDTPRRQTRRGKNKKMHDDFMRHNPELRSDAAYQEDQAKKKGEAADKEAADKEAYDEYMSKSASISFKDMLQKAMDSRDSERGYPTPYQIHVRETLPLADTYRVVSMGDDKDMPDMRPKQANCKKR